MIAEAIQSAQSRTPSAVLNAFLAKSQRVGARELSIPSALHFLVLEKLESPFVTGKCDWKTMTNEETFLHIAQAVVILSTPPQRLAMIANSSADLQAAIMDTMATLSLLGISQAFQTVHDLISASFTTALPMKPQGSGEEYSEGSAQKKTVGSAG